MVRPATSPRDSGDLFTEVIAPGAYCGPASTAGQSCRKSQDPAPMHVLPSRSQHGTSRHFAAMRDLVAIGVIADLIKPDRSSSIYKTQG